jgi:hypothetical protein
MIETIYWKGVTVGLFIGRDHSPGKTEFLTISEEPLQCGIGVFQKDSRVEPHRHVGDPATVSEFQEFILLRKGKCLAEVFDPEGKSLRKIEMQAGDALLLLRGGHAFYFQEDTEFLEVKQGPYLGREKMKQPLKDTLF